MTNKHYTISTVVDWDWRTWGLGFGVSVNPTRPYRVGLEVGPLAVFFK